MMVSGAESNLLHARSGPLTADLVQSPAAFGLGQVPQRLSPDGEARMVCGFCATGCNLRVHLRDGQAVNVTPDPNYPVNLGMACPKGWEALTPLQATDRATTPLLRDATGQLRPVDWPQALDAFVENFQRIQQYHGPESVAFLSTGQIVSEEMAFLGALAKFGMGMIHGDGNTRQCMATAVTAYKESFGFDAPPYTYGDFEESDVIVLVGSNLCIAHPIMWQRVMRNPHSPKIIVLDPRRTETAMAATHHLALRPKTDLVLLYGLAHLLIKEGYLDEAFIAQNTEGYEAFREHVEDYAPKHVAALTGIPEANLREVAGLIGQGKRVSFWWTMGVNQSHEATRTAQAIINLALMTGNIGRPGTGANSITGQCNAMGSRLFSNTTTLLGGHQFTSETDRQKVARVLDIPVRHIPDQNSWAYDQIMEGIGEGKIKGLWIIATNTAHSWMHQQRAQALLNKLDFLVVQDMYTTTETVEMADLVLPAAGWGEKEGTFINSERRIGLVKRVAQAPGQALADFSIFRLLAQRWGVGEMFKKWTSPEAVFDLLKEVSRDQPCDITGIDGYDTLEREGGIQWPLPDALRNGHLEHPAKERRLFTDGKFYSENQKAKFIFDVPRGLPEPTDEQYPLLLLTGRGTSSQWHTQSRTSKSKVLRKLYPQKAYVEINPTDARRLGIRASQQVEVVSRRGRLHATAFLTPTVACGQVFVPMHYAKANQLTYPEVDPHSRQPAYKACAVRIEG